MPLAIALALWVLLGDMTPTRANATVLAQAVFLDALAIEGVICQGETERTLVSGIVRHFGLPIDSLLFRFFQMLSRRSHYDDDVMM